MTDTEIADKLYHALAELVDELDFLAVLFASAATRNAVEVLAAVRAHKSMLSASTADADLSIDGRAACDQAGRDCRDVTQHC